MTTTQAIETSRREDRTVTMPWSEDAESDLLAECDDSADNGNVTEYWGSDWRVDLVRG